MVARPSAGFAVRRISFTFLLTGLFAYTAALAQAADAPPFAALLRQSQANAPQLLEQAATARAASADARQAGAWLNPTLSVTAENPGAPQSGAGQIYRHTVVRDRRQTVGPLVQISAINKRLADSAGDIAVKYTAQARHRRGPGADVVRHPREIAMHTGVVYALLAAVLFGASTPFAKMLAGQMPPAALAGVLYLGSGLGLSVCYAIRAMVKRNGQDKPVALSRQDLPWLAGAITAGGVAGPLLLMAGLGSVSASSASLLLNMEGVLTSMLAWFVFKENFDRRIFLGMLLIVAAGVLLSWEQTPAAGLPWGAMSIVGACLCWGIDNNLTRKVSGSDPLQIAGAKGLVAGSVNLAIHVALGGAMPETRTALLAGLVGFCGYGLSLVLFVLALRHLGTARAGAYFSAAPFAGAALSLLMPGEVPGALFWIAAALMGWGIWLHISESHAHEHEHAPLSHAHPHRHDDHHRHEHDFDWNGSEPHAHAHQHTPLRHSHPHYPDIHHRHEH